MKKLLAAGCCVLFIHNFSQVSVGNELLEQKAAGQKVLIKAITAIVNTEGNKKAPQKRVCITSAEGPWF
jgi:hypothetical protein